LARRSNFLGTLVWVAVGYEVGAYLYNGIRANQVLTGTSSGETLPGPLPLDGIGALIGYGPFVTALTVQ
jgi:hypothetical protein